MAKSALEKAIEKKQKEEAKNIQKKIQAKNNQGRFQIIHKMSCLKNN